jgi:hypothetical protein
MAAITPSPPISNPMTPLEIGNELMVSSFALGGYCTECQTMESSTGNDSVHLDAMCRLFAQISCERENAAQLAEQSKKAAGSAGNLLRNHGTALLGQFKFCYDQLVYPIFDSAVIAQVDKLNGLVEHLRNQMQSYRTTRAAVDRDQLPAALERLRSCLALTKTLSDRCSICFSREDQPEIIKIQNIAARMGNLIQVSSQSEETKILHILDSICEKELPKDQTAKEALQDTWHARFAKFPPEMQKDIDVWISGLASQPNPTAKWSEQHRFEDFKRFRNAYYIVVQGKIENDINDELENKPQEVRNRVYRILHEFALGPMTVAPIEWARNELPYLRDLVNEALDEIEACDKLPSELDDSSSSDEDSPAIAIKSERRERLTKSH